MPDEARKALSLYRQKALFLLISKPPSSWLWKRSHAGGLNQMFCSLMVSFSCSPSVHRFLQSFHNEVYHDLLRTTRWNYTTQRFGPERFEQIYIYSCSRNEKVIPRTRSDHFSFLLEGRTYYNRYASEKG